MYSKLSCKLNPRKERREREKKNVKRLIKLLSKRLSDIETPYQLPDFSLRKEKSFLEVVQPIKPNNAFLTVSHYMGYQTL